MLQLHNAARQPGVFFHCIFFQPQPSKCQQHVAQVGHDGIRLTRSGRFGPSVVTPLRFKNRAQAGPLYPTTSVSAIRSPTIIPWSLARATESTPGQPSGFGPGSGLPSAIGTTAVAVWIQPARPIVGLRHHLATFGPATGRRRWSPQSARRPWIARVAAGRLLMSGTPDRDPAITQSTASLASVNDRARLTGLAQPGASPPADDAHPRA